MRHKSRTATAVTLPPPSRWPSVCFDGFLFQTRTAGRKFKGLVGEVSAAGGDETMLRRTEKSREDAGTRNVFSL